MTVRNVTVVHFKLKIIKICVVFSSFFVFRWFFLLFFIILCWFHCIVSSEWRWSKHWCNYTDRVSLAVCIRCHRWRGQHCTWCSTKISTIVFSAKSNRSCCLMSVLAFYLHFLLICKPLNLHVFGSVFYCQFVICCVHTLLLFSFYLLLHLIPILIM